MSSEARATDARASRTSSDRCSCSVSEAVHRVADPIVRVSCSAAHSVAHASEVAAHVAHTVMDPIAHASGAAAHTVIDPIAHASEAASGLARDLFEKFSPHHAHPARQKSRAEERKAAEQERAARQRSAQLPFWQAFSRSLSDGSLLPKTFGADGFEEASPSVSRPGAPDPRSAVWTGIGWDGGAGLLAPHMHFARLRRHAATLGIAVPADVHVQAPPHPPHPPPLPPREQRAYQRTAASRRPFAQVGETPHRWRGRADLQREVDEQRARLGEQEALLAQAAARVAELEGGARAEGGEDGDSSGAEGGAEGGAPAARFSVRFHTAGAAFLVHWGDAVSRWSCRRLHSRSSLGQPIIFIYLV